ncbi:S39A6 [Dirofilaria immitis]|nr:S39A6 [Dirofilaria immitis]
MLSDSLVYYLSLKLRGKLENQKFNAFLCVGFHTKEYMLYVRILLYDSQLYQGFSTQKEEGPFTEPLYIGCPSMPLKLAIFSIHHLISIILSRLPLAEPQLCKKDSQHLKNASYQKQDSANHNIARTALFSLRLYRKVEVCVIVAEQMSSEDYLNLILFLGEKYDFFFEAGKEAQKEEKLLVFSAFHGEDDVIVLQDCDIYNILRATFYHCTLYSPIFKPIGLAHLRVISGSDFGLEIYQSTNSFGDLYVSESTWLQDGKRRICMKELEWSPSTSTLQPTNISELCTNWIKTVESIVPDRQRHIRPSNFIIWTVGLTCITVISLCAAVGIVLVRNLSKRTYNYFITILVAVGVGSLITSSTLHLLPQSLGIVDGENYDFIVVMMFCVFGIYIFFFCDKFIKITLESKKMNEIEMLNNAGTHLNMEAGVVSIRSTDALITENGIFAVFLKQCDETSNAGHTTLDMSRQAHGICVHDHEITFNQTKDSAIKTVAWMIVFGDGLHNFIDGVSIGAAFSESLLTGLSVSVSVFAEEFPHELGDVAILLNAGMNQKQALFYNLLSTITCFIGFITGVVLGSVESFLRYIFGFSGGMFLYIALSCMMPEMKSTMEEALENGYLDAFFVLSLQATGLVLGTESTCSTGSDFDDDVHV